MITYKDLPIQEPHKLIFYISSAVTKIKGFMKVIKNPLKLISDLKAVYKGIKEIKQPEGSIKRKKIIIPWTQRYFEILKNKPSRTIKALNTPFISKKSLEENFIEFNPEAFPLVSLTLLTASVKKLNLTTLKIISESFLSNLESLTSTTNSNSSNIITTREKMIMWSQEFYGRPEKNPKAWYDNFIVDAIVNGWDDDQLLNIAAGFFKSTARE